uniref:Uncharacterized protein n=1 Tax=Sphenodon punctatus TaxID=8508 RepID=A0A8D0H9F9_SPHPU
WEPQIPRSSQEGGPFSLMGVTLWLKKTFGDQPVPQYEVNARTIDILYELAECNEARDRDVALITDDMKQKTTEYESEGELGRVVNVV